jgi:two-component system invasion response regulator UvrY
MPRIALADDHPIVRRGFKQLIETVAGYVVTVEHGDGEALLEDPQLDECDLLLLDITLPGVDGFEVLRRLQPRARRPEVIVLSMHEALPFVREALRLGARGYLAKSGADDELLVALAAVSAGGTYLSASFRERFAALGPDRDPAFPELTARECEIVRALVRGDPIRLIGERLGMSRKTVYVHRSNLLGKLGVNSDVELVELARRRGLLAAG